MFEMQKETDVRYTNWFSRMISKLERETHISDTVKLSYEDEVCLDELWIAEGVTTSVPCDLLINRMLPLPNVHFEIDERDYSDKAKPIKYDILVPDVWQLPDIKDRIAKLANEKVPDGKANIVFGPFMRMNMGGKDVYVPSYYIPGDDVLVFDWRIYSDGEVFKMEANEQVKKHLASYFITWYGLQIALLNPITKTCFKGMQDSTKADHRKNASKKRTACYTRKIYVKKGDLKKRIAHSRKIKALSWYVIGHWRHYKTGKSVFINGYWKGVLRATKQNHDEGRERTIQTREEFAQ